jgi:hypothetical protein
MDGAFATSGFDAKRASSLQSEPPNASSPWMAS